MSYRQNQQIFKLMQNVDKLAWGNLVACISVHTHEIVLDIY